MTVVGVYDGNSWLLAFTTEKRNPIIFARTETSHLPKSLQHETQIKDVTHTIYSSNKDGSLKCNFCSFGSALNPFLLVVQEKK